MKDLLIDFIKKTPKKLNNWKIFCPLKSF